LNIGLDPNPKLLRFHTHYSVLQLEAATCKKGPE